MCGQIAHTLESFQKAEAEKRKGTRTDLGKEPMRKFRTPIIERMFWGLSQLSQLF